MPEDGGKEGEREGERERERERERWRQARGYRLVSRLQRGHAAVAGSPLSDPSPRSPLQATPRTRVETGTFHRKFAPKGLFVRL